jgi:hypothetical protein
MIADEEIDNCFEERHRTFNEYGSYYAAKTHPTPCLCAPNRETKMAAVCSEYLQ